VTTLRNNAPAPAERMSTAVPRLQLQGLRKTFHRRDGTAFHAVDDLSIEVGGGEFLVLLGASGCGKTTLLRCVAGLERPDAGRIALNGRAVFDSGAGVDIPPERRQIGMVFQSYALWPHMTVAQNVAYPLQMRGVSKDAIGAAVRKILSAVNIAELANQHPGQISGGQQQRVALARALVCGDDLILFDEPLSNVDAKVREHLRLELLAMQREFGFTALYVTHDQDEAMALATQIAVITKGGIAQLGTPQDVYLRPRTAYVARFVGSANQLEGTLCQRDGPVVDTVLGPIAVLPHNIRARSRDVIVVSRPERWSIAADQSGDALVLDGHIVAAAFVGSHNEYLVGVGDARLRVWSFGQSLLDTGTSVRCAIPRDDLLVLDREGAP
jgi:iron(III) transport system ATP-binding protein